MFEDPQILTGECNAISRRKRVLLDSLALHKRLSSLWQVINGADLIFCVPVIGYLNFISIKTNPSASAIIKPES